MLNLDATGSEHRTWVVQSVLIRYGLAITGVACGAAIRWLLGDMLGQQGPFLIFYPFILLSAALGGIGPGLLALVLSAAVGEYLFVGPPIWSDLPSVAETVRLALFLLSGGAVALLGGFLRASQVRVEHHCDEVREAQDALRISEDRFRSIFNQAAIGICLAQPDGTMRMVNQKLCDMLGYRVEELLKLSYKDITCPDDWPSQVVQAKRLMAGEIPSYSMEKRYIRKDGTLLWATLTCSAVREQQPYVVAVIEDISIRKQAEEARQESEEKFRTMAENAASAFGIVQGDRFIYANEYFARISGYTREELLQVTFPQLVHPSFRPMMIDRAARRQRGEYVPSHYEFLMVCKGGEERWVDFSPARIMLRGKPAVIGTGYDITERKRAEAALRRSEVFLRRVIDATPSMIFVKDWSGRFVLANEALARCYGTTPQEVVGRTDADFDTNAEEVAHFLADDRRVMTTRQECHVSEERVTQFDGQIRWFNTVKVPLINDDGTCDKVLGVATDITDRRLAGEALRQSESCLMEAKETAEAASRAKDQFLAVLSHELRTPLTPVLATATLLASDPDLSAEMREDLDMIRRNVELEARLIDDLLDLTRISRGKLELKLQPIDTCKILRDTVEVCAADIAAKDLHLGMDVTNGNHWLRADPSRLQQVFWNLLKNAIKFTPHGGCIGIECSANDDHVVVQFTDSGVGIDPEVLPRLFGAFEQGSRLVTKKFGGLGLGLAISKALVELHGGKIEAHSEGRDKGATFRVTLPTLQPAENAAPTFASPGSEASPPGPPTRHRILLVEDHVDTARTFMRLLESRGYEVRIAGTVQQALELAGQERFDLVISDLGLPDGSGLDVMRGLRQQGDVKGIALSGYGMEEDINKSREAGFSDHLTKPVDLIRLSDAVKSAINGAVA